jgi:capsid protein
MKRLFSWIKARYDAAVQWWGERSWILGGLQDAHLDIDKATREEIVRKHRYFVANNPIVNRIRELKIQFAVGPSGLQCVPNSSDEAWNEAKSENFKDWSREPEVNSSLPLEQCESVWEGMLFESGEIFVHLTEKQVGNRKIPAIETIESHRCATPPEKLDEEGKTIIDGVAIDSNGAETGFYIRDAFNKKKYSFIPRDEMIHKFKVLRPGQRRGLPDGFSSLNKLHDYVDLHNLEMKAAKAASRITNVVTNAAGEVPSAARLRRQLLNIGSVDQNNNSITKQASDYYEITQGGDTVYLKKGEDVKQFASNRPSVATQDYWDLNVAEICCGYNVPKLLVMPFSLQGTVTRADLDIATGAFRRDFEIIASIVREIYEWQTL